jgi:cytoskeletal protein CcmA (bactofilin family)
MSEARLPYDPPPGEVAFRAAPAPIIAADAGFSGLLHVRGPARIDGQVTGEVIVSDTVWIGETGRVRARVEAREVVVAGELTGEVRASERIELLATARVKAALHTRRLVLADGSFLEGRCHAGGGEAAASEPPAGPISDPEMP